MSVVDVAGLGELLETNLSCVKYYQGYKPWAYISLLPLFAAVFQLGRFWTSRSIEDGFVFVGFLITEAVNQVLKKHFQRPRPPTCEQLGVCSSYGYPSSHSQCIWYFITCGSLVLWRRSVAEQRQHLRSGPCPAESASNTFALLSALFCGIAVPASRVVLGYHTVEQVVAGSACGVACGLIWSWITCGPVGSCAAHVCRLLRLDQLLGLTAYCHWAGSEAAGSRGIQGNSVDKNQ